MVDMTPRMKKKIHVIPEFGKWRNSSSAEVFEEVGKELLDHGFSEDAAVSVLSKLFVAVADEYGV